MSLTYGEIALRLIVSMVVGILLGEERKIRGKQVGTRTHALVCLAATFITMISAYGFADFEGSRTMDPARLVVGILTGIGFLGAGIIWRGEGGSLYGLTTAANIWMISAIGIGIGLGHFFLVGLTVVLVVITLEIGTPIYYKLKL